MTKTRQKPLICFLQMVLIYILIFFLMPASSEAPITMICIILNACLAIALSIAFFHTELTAQWKVLVKNKKLWGMVGLLFLLDLLAKILGVMVERSFGAAGSHNGQAALQSANTFPVVMTIYLCVIAPCAEELIFRFCLEKLIDKKWLFIFISSLVFGSMHVLSGDFTPFSPTCLQASFLPYSTPKQRIFLSPFWRIR